LASTANAGEFLFNWDIEIDQGGDTSSGVTRTNDIRSLAEQINTQKLEQLFDVEDLSDPSTFSLSAELDLRGVPTVVIFDVGSTELEFTAPFLDETVRFDAGSRDESVEQFEDWLEGEYHASDATDDSLTALLQELVAESAVDPIAGNPNSLQTKIFEATYAMGTTGVFRPRKGTPEADEWTGKDHFRAGALYEYFSADVWNGNVFEAGIDYQLNLRNPTFALIMDLPLVITQTEGSESFIISAGIGVMYRPTHWWNITPSFRLGGAGSFKLGAIAFMPSASITSSMRWAIGSSEFTIAGRKVRTTDFELGIGNMFGWSGTIDDIEIAGTRVAYELDNYALRNGIDLTKRLSMRLLGGQTAIKLFFVDTWILGSEVYMDHYNELGVQLSTQRVTGDKWRDQLAFHTAWVVGRNYDAVQLRLSFRF
jgi:hypothetical protein